MTLDATALRRRFIWLNALRWLPTGLLLPVLVVLALERGLSLTEVGLVFAVQGVTVMLLELPTGGLADALGRRPVLLLATVFDLATLGLLLVADSLALYALAMLFQGAYRALESGPLDAWFVDASLVVDPDADIERGMSRRGVALGVAIAIGSLGGAGLALVDIPGLPPLTTPILVSLGLRIVDLVAIATLVHEVRPARGLAAWRASVGAVPAVVAGTMRLLRASPALLSLVLIELLWGAGMTGVETFTAPRMVDLLGDPQSGVAAVGVAGALAWTVSGLGSGATPWLIRRLGSAARAGVALRIAQGAGYGLAAVLAGPAGLLAGYFGFYLVHGAANAVHYGMVHRLVGPEHRTTMVSANSLTSRLGGTVSGIALGALADGAGIVPAIAVAAALLAAGAPLYLVAGRARPLPPRHVDVAILDATETQAGRPRGHAAWD